MGDIFVFLTGQDDIDAAVQLLSKKAHNSRYQGLIVLPLYSGLPRADQGIVYVVDTGFSKQRFDNMISDIENMVIAQYPGLLLDKGLVGLEEFDLENASSANFLP
ncbi:hypothetical protein M9H77_26047 [Catharanthus roseus]|uniref:Uncharacterized protein n=1 Tax=Catharanthus roseus TaxID=4058 RepID=A0ACC0AAP2_CATRO|nr:hypothetical protein M9H77_26047 [Catharanthus roseus]